ncbi:SDR family oxidoreductase [Paracnuella aquatica]|uniref:SDR family oxidoreductase n=1 Tax=Paracnuella aquatica TaxID=2268757 RepID=UPI000DEF1FFD|nr:SDR family oxidoreductase [Paracnuella aquatica]RPD51703.1 SDR family oxidoreductase [Paracnuella aquatica]
MKTVLITGANGFVGHYLAAKLLRCQYKVIATAKGEQRLSINHPQFFFQNLDITDEQAVAAVTQRWKPHVVVHCAAMTKPDECELNKEAAWQVNVTGTEQLLQSAANNGSPHFVHLSTDFVFAGDTITYNEEDEAAPVNYYGVTKWEAEQKVRQYRGNWTIVRPILIYGHPQAGRSNLLTVVADALKASKEVKLFTDQQRRPTYVEDLVWGLEKIISQGVEGVFHFSGKDTLSPYDMGKRVAEYLSLDADLVLPVTASQFQQPARRPPQTIFDLQKVTNEFGYKPTPFAEGLRKTFNPPVMR